MNVWYIMYMMSFYFWMDFLSTSNRVFLHFCLVTFSSKISTSSTADRWQQYIWPSKKVNCRRPWRWQNKYNTVGTKVKCLLKLMVKRSCMVDVNSQLKPSTSNNIWRFSALFSRRRVIYTAILIIIRLKKKLAKAARWLSQINWMASWSPDKRGLFQLVTSIPPYVH